MKKIFVFSNSQAVPNYIHALEHCGAKAVCGKELSLSAMCSGLLLTGGGDPDPSLYGEEINGSRNIDRERDAAELWLIKAFYETGRPILGICRGLQILAVAFGGSLYQDIDSTAIHAYDETDGDRVHTVLSGGRSFLSPIYGHSFAVNSAHHQALKRFPVGFTVSALSKDGIVEAMEHNSGKIFAVQFHPERMCFEKERNDTVDGKKVFLSFLEKIP